MCSKQKGNGKQVVADQKMTTNSLERVPENHAATTAPVSVKPIEPGKKSKTKENKRFMFYFLQEKKLKRSQLLLRKVIQHRGQEHTKGCWPFKFFRVYFIDCSSMFIYVHIYS
ncbi:hypothetical protein ILYODFUR_036226 [Ilyodon furcidens]|uniref:Uncharacterized protein n=1 Tax=Ilyodon furcidens TaxID=33524 RepID=A0ABV0UN17_9TELE